MSAPSPTNPGTPSGIMLDNGFKTQYVFSRDPTICFKERTVKPSGRDGGPAIETSTQRNTRHRTFAPRALVANTPAVIKCSFDPNDRARIENNLMNQPGSVTEWFPDGSSYCYYGYLMHVDYDEMEDAKKPEATITIQVTNYDPVAKVEAGPVMTQVVGT